MCLHVPPSELLRAASASTECRCQGCKDLDELVSELKVKMSCTELKKNRLMILTLAPQSWTIERTMAEFGVSAYMVKLAQSLRNTHGILADTTIPKMGKRLSQETVEKVISFYKSDEVSRICPGQKEFVSVKLSGKKVQKAEKVAYQTFKTVFFI